MSDGYNLIICLDNFDDISNEYKKKFWDLSMPLTLKTSNKDMYSDFKQDDTKFLTNSIIVPKLYMSIYANGDAKEIRNSIYNSVSISKEQGICILIINVCEENEETVYYALNDSLSVFDVNKIDLCTFNFIYS